MKLEVKLVGKFIAHTENSEGKTHDLKDHIYGTANKARKFADKWSMGDLAYISGLLHDLGKYSDQFQDYLKNNSSGVEHAIAGAIYAKNNKSIKYSNILPFFIAGHHSGLHNLTDLKNSLKEKANKDFVKSSINNFSNNIKLEYKENENSNFDIKNDPLELEFFMRMMFSSLVDADYLDTEKHFDLNKYTLRDLNNYDTEGLWNKFSENQNKLMEEAEKSKLNDIRNNIYDSVLNKSEQKNKFYSLTVPTGGGKTRTGLGFALKHAKFNNMDRIIVVIPYTNIIEQTAKTYKEILGEENILEHHSNFDFNEDEEKYNKEKIKLATENWDMPVVVTTSVQFFESLFSHKTSKLRKLHNLANSTIIFDEVQTLPPEYLNSILQVLKQLVKNYNSSIVFSTATQPAFGNRDKFNGLKNIEELVPDTDDLFRNLARVEYDLTHIEKKLSWNQVTELMLEEKQALTVVNTKDDAKELYSILSKKSENVYHLSTYMCSAHRKIILNKVKEKLANNESCYLISTQLIEAGVDIDFSLVLRAMAPLDSIVQAAGRCNRENKLDKGKVIVFTPQENKLPKGIYKMATDKSKIFLDDPKQLLTAEIFLDYFATLYKDANLDKKEINELRKSFKFREVSRKFKIIPDDTVNVIIENNDIVDQLPVNLNVIKDKEFISREEWRKLQPYIISIRKYKVNDLLKDGMLYELLEDVYVWNGKYDQKEGIMLDGYNFNDYIQ
ncbi:CRISPR-associated Cas3 family helicase [Halanaerobium saccharolyticum]|uniref:CRISPR-associated Cas3 family helicase n=1 Tax=Halanaerobium saccharolyticum TaxID=43595 RepID=A0A4R6RW02_9FIRM|nr:CRISPR-associated Cas3 family helicase [Halanaerobium saccharolyticum]